MKKFIVAATLLASASVGAEVKVLAISGSTRADSYNRKLLMEAVELAKQNGAVVTDVDLKDYALPFYDGDLEATQGMPENAKRLRQLMINSNTIIIASPEYNGSMAGILKNVLDWASRSENAKPSRDAFKGKKFIILSTSPGPGGGSRGLGHLKEVIENVGGNVIAQLSVPDYFKTFNSQGRLESEPFKTELKKAIDSSTK